MRVKKYAIQYTLPTRAREKNYLSKNNYKQHNLL